MAPITRSQTRSQRDLCVMPSHKPQNAAASKIRVDVIEEHIEFNPTHTYKSPYVMNALQATLEFSLHGLMILMYVLICIWNIKN